MPEKPFHEMDPEVFIAQILRKNRFHNDSGGSGGSSRDVREVLVLEEVVEVMTIMVVMEVGAILVWW